MTKPPIPENEAERLAALDGYHLLDTKREAIYDNITWIAAKILKVPIALITLVAKDRQWFKSTYGLDGVSETSRDVAFCAYTILNKELFEVQDALQDERFKENPLVQGNPNIRFYVGAPLSNNDGLTLGSLCLIDKEPKKLTSEEREILKKLSEVVIDVFEMSKSLKS